MSQYIANQLLNSITFTQLNSCLIQQEYMSVEQFMNLLDLQ